MPIIDDFLLGRSTSFTLGSATENRTNLSLTQSAAPSATIHGRVTSSVDGSPLADVTVKIRSQAGDPIAHTTTNPGGNYTFTIAPGTYTINVSLHGYATPSGQTFTVTGGQALTINFIMSPEVRPLNVIFGVVTDQVTGLPILGAKVILIESPAIALPPTSVVLTNSTGEYMMCEIPDGSYLITANQTGYHQSSFISITISGGQIIPTNIQLQPVGVPQSTVNGFITKTDGTAIANAYVGLYSLDLLGVETLLQATYTDATGFYIFGRASAGTYVVKSKLETTVSHIG